MLEMTRQTALPRRVEQSFLGHLCSKHTHTDIQRDFAMLFQKAQGEQRQHLWHIDSWDTTVDYPDVPMSGSQGTCPNGQPLGSPDPGPVSGSTCLSSSTACPVNRLDKTTLLTWEAVHICKFNIRYMRCHVGDEMSNCIAKTCRTKLLGTPLLKTHRRVSAKCVTYSGTAWKFQQAQGKALLHWDVVCRYSSLKTHFQLTSSRTNFNTLHRKTSLWHEDSWDTTVWDNTDVSGVNVSCCRTAWRYQQA